MFESFYSLSAPPFQLTPDCRFFFGSQEHKKAMAFLQYGIAQREGFVVITGDVGAGKTTLMELLLANLSPGKYVAGRVASAQLDGYEIVCAIAEAFRVTADNAAKGALLGRIRERFDMLHEQGKRPLVIIDEAQGLHAEAFEELRMLSNMTLDASAPFQCILLGQPELRATLSDPQSEQFRQRVVASCHLGALAMEDTRKYIEHRLALVGWKDDPHFFADTFEEIHRRTGGLPRRINMLCARLLLLGFLEEKHAIEASDATKVAEELALELGPLSAPVEAVHANGVSLAAAVGRAYDDLQSRLRHVERANERHQRAFKRVLDLARRYVQSQDPK